ncbi:MAG: hypothetical protein VCD50_01295 [Alphaproteobacteria bacterium]|jgi:hypothetical protein
MSENEYPDRFERAFNQRIPSDVANSFTDEQRAAIRTAFGGERWDGHRVDLRGVIPMLRWYFAFVAGPNKRSKRRLSLDDDIEKPSLIGRIIGALTVLVVVALLAVLLFS